MTSLPRADDALRLREALESARYTETELEHRFGGAALAAARRGDFRAVLAASDDDPQSVVMRLFLCGTSESADAVTRALAPLDPACGLLERDGDEYRAALRLDLHSGRWLLSDRTDAAGLSSEHVLGPAAAAASMAGYMVRQDIGAALDIGTGCGVLAAELSGHAERVTGTDISPRALEFAAANAALNGLDWELVRGDLAEPVRDRRFDHVVSNPPFIIGPGLGDYDYRDSGRPGDAVCAELARDAVRLLNPDGTLQFMANWCHVKGQDWTERIAAWFADAGCQVWAIQREAVDPLEYVRFWERDAADSHDPHRLAAWLDWFDANDVEAVGFGVINARRSASCAAIKCEDLRQTPERRFGELIAEWFDARARLDALTPAALLAARPRLADGVQLRQDAVAGAEGWRVERQMLESTAGLRRAEEIDPLLVSFVAGCRGDVDVRTLAGLLAHAHDADPALLAAALSPVVRDLTDQGFLTLDGG
ncbi:MAG TPA: methyltransferase [Stackebrandtia sp.]|uniref:DUF7782 domain-containing protein n=1 Tax=Stackebrandtia sp. TaxID=2023065 RepID=UPI002D465758|nr:methyltransferase [Stackebrandtia sp.]HZE38686.1 methyltransferase [Stackebrandtia sp.]